MLRVSATIYRPDGSGNSKSGEITRTIPVQPSMMDFFGAERYEVRRVERYLALFAGFRIPYVADAGIQDQDPNSHYEYSELLGGLTSSQRWDLSEEVNGIFRSAQTLLDSLPDDSFLGKAAENVGESAIDDSADRRFVHAWNAVELLAKRHHIGSEKLDPKRPFPRVVRPRVYVPRFLTKYSDAAIMPDVGHLVALRNGIAHGGLSDPPGSSFRDHLERWDKAAAIRDLAFEVLINVLGEEGVIPRMDRPVHARVMVPSFRPDWKVEPIDDSAILGMKGTLWDGDRTDRAAQSKSDGPDGEGGSIR